MTLRSLQLRGGSGAFASPAILLSPWDPGTRSYTLDDVVALGGNGTDTTNSPGAGLNASSRNAETVIDLTIRDSEFVSGTSVDPTLGGVGGVFTGPGLAVAATGSLFAGDRRLAEPYRLAA